MSGGGGGAFLESASCLSLCSRIAVSIFSFTRLISSSSFWIASTLCIKLMPVAVKVRRISPVLRSVASHAACTRASPKTTQPPTAARSTSSRNVFMRLSLIRLRACGPARRSRAQRGEGGSRGDLRECTRCLGAAGREVADLVALLLLELLGDRGLGGGLIVRPYLDEVIARPDPLLRPVGLGRQVLGDQGTETGPRIGHADHVDQR